MYRSPLRNVKSTESSPMVILEHSSSEKDRINLSETQILTYPLSGATKSISARISREFVTDPEDGLRKIVHLTVIWKLLHLASFSRASSDELMFLSGVATYGPEQA